MLKRCCQNIFGRSSTSARGYLGRVVSHFLTVTDILLSLTASLGQNVGVVGVPLAKAIRVLEATLGEPLLMHIITSMVAVTLLARIASLGQNIGAIRVPLAEAIRALDVTLAEPFLMPTITDWSPGPNRFLHIVQCQK